MTVLAGSEALWEFFWIFFVFFVWLAGVLFLNLPFRGKKKLYSVKIEGDENEPKKNVRNRSG